MLYDYTKKPNRKSMLNRIVRAGGLLTLWEDITERCYGIRVANRLRQIAPGDPLLLYDWCGIKLVVSGVRKKDVQEKLDAYTTEQWMEALPELEKLVAKSHDAADEGRQ